MSPGLSWLLLMAGLAAVAVGVDKLVDASDCLQRTVADPSRFDVFPDDAPAGYFDGDEWDAASSGAVQGSASDEPTPLYDQCLDDLDFAAWERQVST